MRLALALLLGAVAFGQVSDRARRLHKDALVFDAHVHVVNRQFHDGSDIGQRLKGGQFDLVRAREGGVDALFFSLYVPEEYYPQRFETKHVLRLLDLAHRQVEANKDKIGIALSPADFDRLQRQGRMAAVLDLEGGFDLDGDLGVLRMLHRLGLRSLQLPAHNWANNFADSCCSKAPKWNGLNEHGRAVIREMNRLGMVINISHASDATVEQALAVSTAPIVATHHGMRALNDIPRTMPDGIMKKLAAKGGVIGFHIGNEFHRRKMFDWLTAKVGKTFWDTSAVGKESPATIADVDRHVAPKFPMMGSDAPDDLLMTPEEWIGVIERAISIVGEDHVMLGSDFDGGPTPPRGMHDVSDLPQLTEAMLRRGWSEARIRKFLGGNLLRVWREIDAAAKR
ncbi:MAG: dipeptidase [Bryobacteraceae bacterium]